MYGEEASVHLVSSHLNDIWALLSFLSWLSAIEPYFTLYTVISKELYKRNIFPVSFSLSREENLF